MNATTHTAFVLEQHRAAELERANEIRRSQAARGGRDQAPRRTASGVLAGLLRGAAVRPAH